MNQITTKNKTGLSYTSTGNNMAINIGDKFINLVNNECRSHKIGDVLVVRDIHEKDDRVGHATIMLGPEDAEYDLRRHAIANNTWWFSEESMNEFLIPFNEVDEKALFAAKVFGKYTGREVFNYTKDTQNLLQSHSASETKRLDIDRKTCLYYYARDIYES